VPAGLIPGDGTRTTLGAWELTELMNQLEAIYRDGDRARPEVLPGNRGHSELVIATRHDGAGEGGAGAGLVRPD